MDRMTNMLAALLLTIAPVALAQEASPNPQVPEDAFSTRQLIAWSGMQKPQPAPQPLPPRDTPVPQPGQPQDQQSAPPGDPNADHAATQSFTGKIMKDSGEYVLKARNKSYHLEQQEGLQNYENQSVKVIGSLDSRGETIRVLKIELIS